MAELKPVVELAKIQMSKKLEEYKQEGKNLTEKEEAALFSQCIVVQTLVAPATAKVPELDDVSVIEKDGYYEVAGYVDVQNSYGTYMREQYTYKLKKLNGSWTSLEVFVDSAQAETEKTINNYNKIFNSNTILWWVLGIIGTIITITVSTCQTAALF